MIDEEKIKFYLRTFKTLGFKDLWKLFQISKKRHLEPGEAYIKEGDMHRKLAYITKGLIRTYTFKPNGEEVTLNLYWEDQFLASRHNVFMRKPSPFIFEAVEKTTILEADYDEIQALLDKNPQYAESRNFFMNNMLLQCMEKVADFLLLTAEERYLKLVSEKPDIVNRVPNKYIATMLGITPVSLSRIRKRVATRR
jgi:CRP-like cAMP-binding protein